MTSEKDKVFSYEDVKKILCEGCRLGVRESVINGKISHHLFDENMVCRANDWRSNNQARNTEPPEDILDTEPKQVIELTQKEVDVLYYILYNCIGGSIDGPRQHKETIQDKLKPKDYKPCRHYSGIRPTYTDNQTRVIYIEKT